MYAAAPRRTTALRLLALATALGIAVGIVTAASPAVSAAPVSPTSPPPGGSSTTDSAAAAKKVTFGIGPANAKGIDGRPYLTFLTTPGAKLTDRIALVNIAKKPVTVNLYVVDTTLGSDGSLGYLPRASKRTDAAKWIVAQTPRAATTVTLAPQKTRVIPLAITVPANASPGDHAAGVIASVISKVITDKSPQGVDFEQRVALRTYFRVSGPLHPQLSVQGLTVKWKGTTNPVGTGSATVDYTVRNTGNVRLGARQKVSVNGLLGGTSTKKPVADIPLLFPGNAVHVSVTVPGVFPQIRMSAKVTLFPLTVAGDVDPGLPGSITASRSFWAIPWPLLAVITALLLLGIGAWLRRRYVRRNRPGPPNGGRHHRGRRRPAGPSGPAGAASPTSDTRKVAGLASMAAAIVAGVLTIAAPSASADTAVPYTDYAVTGSVGLCDAHGQPVTHGNVNDRPFVYRAVSSIAAVKPYDIAGRKATLLAYQPRRGANPNLWGGDTLTSSSTYTNPRYPMAQATTVDFRLKDFLAEYPPQWDGFVQLRIYLGAPAQGTYNDSYPATDIQISGDSWRVVRGASVPCTNGSAKDGETHYIPPTSGASASAKAGSHHSSGAASRGTTGATSSTGAQQGSGPASDVAGSSKSGGGSTALTAVAVVAAVAAVVALGLVYLRRRRGRIG